MRLFNVMRRHLLWRQLLNSSLGYTRKPVEAVSFVHEAMVLESESAYMRRGDSWGYRSRYRYRQGGRRRGEMLSCVSSLLHRVWRMYVDVIPCL